MERINCLSPQKQPPSPYLRDLYSQVCSLVSWLRVWPACQDDRTKLPPGYTGWLFYLSRILFRSLPRSITYKYTSVSCQIVKSRLFLYLPSCCNTQQKQNLDSTHYVGCCRIFTLWRCDCPCTMESAYRSSAINAGFAASYNENVLKLMFVWPYITVRGKGKTVPLQALRGPEGCRKLTFWRRNYFFFKF